VSAVGLHVKTRITNGGWGANGPGNKRARESKFQRTNWPIGQFAPGSEKVVNRHDTHVTKGQPTLFNAYYRIYLGLYNNLSPETNM